ncbi:hypothetical protein [Bartonella krasnovii]|uniref:hypothetical protein n=1 Tax=Bartonella krasnovii TaxID=2267275 RepID=UPI001F4CCFC6|nr:hypothetical protein [Bartonella krasnovii]UNF36509.1 hypothetical protein MNL11_05170 [Bartonella krasnovii]UNF44677.1 hypothetical protein MNL07_04190 [Bartonella krasnovii]UNF50589.1 hypothetical protein MNL03_00905 [Bartonella krasnovii]
MAEGCETFEQTPLNNDANGDRLGFDLWQTSAFSKEKDPLAEGVLMAHQRAWIEDKSPLKLVEKGRRTGITFAEALDDTLIAAATLKAGGDNVFYIGDTKEKGREFISYVSNFARVLTSHSGDVEEFLFPDQKEDGSTKYISAYRVRFASGFRIEALSSRPENIRGLQGIVVIDEAAFHQDVRSVLDAVNALLIWGGKIRVISTHNGVLNPFNELIREARAGKIPFSLHRYPFGEAVKNGLFKRVCAMKGEGWSLASEQQWEKQIRASYGVRLSAMRQELDAIPADQEGAALTRLQIENCCTRDIAVLRFACADGFKNQSDDQRSQAAFAWCEKHVKPLHVRLDRRRQHVFGVDFARSGDATSIVVMEVGQDLVRRVRFMVELRNMPFDQQREILFYGVSGLPRLLGGALDARGNGAYLAEKAAQRYGACVQEIQLSQSWYSKEMPAYLEAFGDGSIVLPRDSDIVADHQALAYVNGIVKIPDNHRFKGSDGFMRHGDSAIACALAYFASRQTPEIYEYTPVREVYGFDDNPLFLTTRSKIY